MALLRFLIVSIFCLAPIKATADTYLLMAETDGCYWCARWNDEIAHIYPKTDEGKVAPLKRYDLYADKPDVTFENRVRYTPTFILVENGVELSRIEGYPGEDFFWVLLAEMLKNAKIPLKNAG